MLADDLEGKVSAFKEHFTEVKEKIFLTWHNSTIVFPQLYLRAHVLPHIT